MTAPTAEQVLSELELTATRSSGPGGQNVNKVNSKIILKFDVRNSMILSGEQKELIMHKLKSRITTEGVLVLSEQESRSQLENRQSVIEKLDELLIMAFKPVRKRKATKPGKASKQKRLDNKRQNGEKKKSRQQLKAD